MKHPAAFCAGMATAMFVFLPGYIVVLFCCAPTWHVFRCVLTCAGYLLTAWTGGKLGQCVSAYEDKAAEVTGYCHPVREKVR